MNCETSTIMDTLHLFIAATLALVATAQGVSNCTNGDVELIQDPADTSIVGYVQYCFRGEWGRVCRESGYMTLWDVSEAAVACRQLGYRSTGYAYVSHDNTWTGGFVSLSCMNGSESSLEDCDPFRIITSREDTCKSGNHARLLCEPANCTDGAIRLVGGSTDREGRVEVCVGGRWGTVQTNQSLEVAEIVCRSQSQILDFYNTSHSRVSRFGYSLSKPVYNCSKKNTNGGLECVTSTIPDDHTRDLGVSCESEHNVLMCPDHQSGQFRLVDGRSHNEGRLEVCVGGQWRGVSTTSLSNTTAGEICTRLGFSADESTVMSFEPTKGDVYCCNNELHCTQCNQIMSAGLKCRTHKSTNSTVITVWGATVGVLLVLLLVTVVALVNTCVALRRKNKQSTQLGESYPRDNRQDNPDGKGSVTVPVPSTKVNPAYDAVKYTQGEETYETVN
ncbi:neurotrypsin-like isoform X2 [Halichondria panicea]|uniref:neurotrypsin-like isoform X2 n=1 Tax=Halichondria panicea TaxID=6063 RepID=UPI00312B62CD